MNAHRIVTSLILSVGLAGSLGSAHAAEELTHLKNTIEALDTALFDAFNRCADPAQLQRHGEFFSEDVEFYHDTGGVTWSREAMLDNTRDHACGKYTRQLVAGSLRVSRIKDFGAIAQGVHRFCQADSERCEGEADFVMIWRQRLGRWQVTRALSYGHRPSAPNSP